MMKKNETIHMRVPADLKLALKRVAFRRSNPENVVSMTDILTNALLSREPEVFREWRSIIEAKNKAAVEARNAAVPNPTEGH